MNKFLLLLLTTLLTSAQTPVTGVSENRDFAIFRGITLEEASLTDYEGKIVILMLMTHW